jgi:putative nucleotidyltransferase with HDIG domain
MDENDIIEHFPEIHDIQNTSLRTAVVRVWLLAVQKGGWQTIDDIPFTLLTSTERTLIDHTRTVTRMAMAIARERSDLDMDTIIAGGLVHDVGKLLEYQRKGSTIVKSDHGQRIRHPVSGYALACEAGVPEAVAHIIAVHSTEGEKVQRSREAIVIHHCDFIDFDIARST